LNPSLSISNRQQKLRLQTGQWRVFTAAIIRDLPGIATFELGVYIMGTAEIVLLNETFLRHRGSTDVITFDYSPAESDGATEPGAAPVHGEIFICADEAVAQAKRFRTTWQRELARYIVHGILHLVGFDDLRAVDRRRMKQAEDLILERHGNAIPSIRRVKPRLI